jgi:hypothetical protein
MESRHVFICDYFPPVLIEVYNYGTNVITDKEPEYGIYEKNLIGLWKIKYKTIDPNISLTEQNICPTWLK